MFPARSIKAPRRSPPLPRLPTPPAKIRRPNRLCCRRERTKDCRVNSTLSLLSDFSVQPIFEDTTVYVLDSKLDAPSPVPSSDVSLLPPPRSSLATQGTVAYHLHLGNLPTVGGFFQVRNARGEISVPATNSIVNRDTTDYTFNFGLNPTVHLGQQRGAHSTAAFRGPYAVIPYRRCR